MYKRRAEKLRPREFKKIHFLEPGVLKPVAITSHDPRVTATLEKNSYSPADYTVSVHLASTAAALDTLITLDLAAANGTKRVLTLYVVARKGT